MKDPFKFQYKSPNLARLQDIFVDSAREGFKTNYTITNKTIRSPKTPKSVSKHYEFRDIDFISDKSSQYQTPAFIKKYNKVLNEFCIPEGNKYITVDLDEKLKLHYLQSQIDLQKLGVKATSQSKLNDIKVNYILGSPNKSSKTEIDYGINTSPRANNYTPKSTNDFVQGTNSIYFSSAEKKKSILHSTFNYIGIKRDEANEYSKSFLNLNRGSPKMSKINHNKKEIYLALYDNEKKVKPMVERIYQLKIAKSQEKDLRKKVILTSINF